MLVGIANSVDPIPSWKAPIQSALLKSVNKSRLTTRSEKKYNNYAANVDFSLPKDMQEKQIKNKFVSLLNGYDSSVGKNHRRSQYSYNSSSSRGSNASRNELTVVLSNEKALGLTKCQGTLHTESTPQVTC